jgi:hypothetical protein
MFNHKRSAALAIGVIALAPAAAIAKPGPEHGGKAKVKPKAHAVTYVFKGSYNVADGSVTVASGNAHVRRAGLVGQRVAFDLSRARVVVADTNGDGAATAADVKDGDKVLVQARLPRRAAGQPPFVARKVVDKSNPPAEDQAPEQD